MNSCPTRWPTCSESAVGSKPMYRPIGPSASRARERVEVGGVVDEATGLEIGEQIHRRPCCHARDTPPSIHPSP